MRFIKEKLEINNNLNPKLWEDNYNLKPEVLNQLNLIIDRFLLELRENNIPIQVVDARIVGSNASFNYTKYSDLDIHIIANFEGVSLNPELLNILYNFFKSKFNDKYDISIHDVDVELYIEDINAPAKSNGIYSIYNQEWLKYPEKLIIQEVDITDLFDEWEDKYIEVIEGKNYKDAIQFINDLYILRKNSISNEGEYGVGNQVFKEFRNLGYIENLKDIVNQGIEDELTLENLQEMLNENLINNSIICYHGSNKNFDKFDSILMGQHDAGQWGKGFYFTDDKRLAMKYGTNIYKCKIKLDNPYIINNDNQDEIDNWIDLLTLEGDSEKVSKNLIERGYDGIIANNDSFILDFMNPSSVVKCSQYVVFDPNNIEILEVESQN